MTEDLKYGILPGKEYVVGRKECSILIDGDKSISRMHATLTVSPQRSQSGPAVLKLRDLKSKFGSFINEQKMVQSSTRELNDGDILEFGVLQSKWRVYWEPLLVTTSCVTSSADKKTLKEAIVRIGGKMVGDWQKDCTYLVMTQLTITVKAVCALIMGKPIVTPTYFQSVMETVDSKLPDPDPKQFLPPLAEDSLRDKDINFYPDKRRKTIFSDKKFLFLSAKQHKKMCTGIELGGGEALLLTSKPDEETLLKPGVCTMSFPPDLYTQSHAAEWADVINAILHRHSRRTIPEAELGLAVLHCSTSEFCNPEFNFGSTLFGQLAMPSQSLSQNSEIYAVDTESPSRTIQTQSLLNMSTQPRCTGSSKVSTIPETRRNQNVSQSLKSSTLMNTERSNTQGRSETTLDSSMMMSVLEAEHSSTDGKRHRPKELASNEPAAKIIKLETQLESVSLEPQSCFSEVVGSGSTVQSNTIKLKQEVFKRPATPQSDEEMAFEWDKPAIDTGADTEADTGAEKSKAADDVKPASIPSLIPVGRRNGFSSSVATVPSRETPTINNNSESPYSECAIVEFCPLIKKKTEERRTTPENGITFNFKKFKKVQHMHANRLPHIIGGSDLVPASQSSRPKPMACVEDEDMEEAADQRQQQQTQEEDLFDW